MLIFYQVLFCLAKLEGQGLFSSPLCDQHVLVFACVSCDCAHCVWLQAASGALSSLGHVYTAIGDYPNALASHKQCVLLARQTRCQLSEARQLGDMGAVYTALGDFPNAVQCHEQHLDIAKVRETWREKYSLTFQVFFATLCCVM